MSVLLESGACDIRARLHVTVVWSVGDERSPSIICGGSHGFAVGSLCRSDSWTTGVFDHGLCRLQEDAHSNRINEEMEASTDSARNAKTLINPKKKRDYSASPGVLGMTPAR